jgi:glutamate-1-semialdehyde aminotransferase
MSTLTSDAGPFSGAYFTPNQQDYLLDFLKRFQNHRSRSRQLAALTHQVLANRPMAFPFQYPLKEFFFPLSIANASGATLEDTDGNYYIDFSMGYGSRLFGYEPAFTRDEVPLQIGQTNFALGFLPKESAQGLNMLGDLTQFDRFYFCTTGTEAAMIALRLARAATGKSKIAVFRGSNHGQYDDVVWTQPESQDLLTGWGIPPGRREDLLLLDYCQESSLELLAQHRESLAAVLVEPFQTSHPELNPAGFLRELQALARRSQFVLILDEMVSGFRLHSAGARGFLGIEADLVLYGKALGDGMPLAVLAGQRPMMDLLDGGAWQFGDCSRPALLTIPHGGTYNLHPLSFQSMNRVLRRMVREGPALQESLNRNTATLLAGLNHRLEEIQAPVLMAGWGSYFGPVWRTPEAQQWVLPLLHLHLLDQGVLLWGLRGFLCTAHVERDLVALQDSFCAALSQLRAAGFQQFIFRD